MSLVMLDVAKARIAEAHLEAERSRDHRRAVIERRRERRARRVVSPRRGPSRLLRVIPAPRPTGQ